MAELPVFHVAKELPKHSEVMQPEQTLPFSITRESLQPVLPLDALVHTDVICMAHGLPSFASFHQHRRDGESGTFDRTFDSPPTQTRNPKFAKSWQSAIEDTIDETSDPNVYDNEAETRGGLLLLLFFLVEAARIMVDEWALYDSGTVVQPLLVAQSLISVVVGLSLSVVSGHGTNTWDAFGMIFSVRDLLQCLPAAMGFYLSQLLIAWAFAYGLGAATSIVLGNLYLPLCVCLSQWWFDRKYGRLDTLALSMLTLCSFTFGELRNAELGRKSQLRRRVWIFSIASTTLACFASLFAERLMKTKYTPEARNIPFFVQNSRLQIGVFIISFIVLLVMQEGTVVSSSFRLDIKFLVALFLRVTQGWIAGLVAKTFSNMSKAVITNLSFLVIYFMGDWIFRKRTYAVDADGNDGGVKVDHFTVSALACLVALIALLYQVGRERTQQEGLINLGRSLASSRNVLARISLSVKTKVSGCCQEGVFGCVYSSFVRLPSHLVCVVVFILADAGRTVLKEWFWRQDVSKSITPQTVVAAGSLISVCVGSIVSFGLDGCRGLRDALSPSETIRCLPVAICFSLAQTFTTLAFSYKLSGLANNVLGFSYMPLSAILSTCIFRRKYVALEWLSLMLIMLSAFVFVQLQAIGKGIFGYVSEIDNTSDDEHSVLAVLCCFASVVFACIGSMAAEKIMKTSNTPFHQQKTYMDLGCFLAALVMLVVMGVFDIRTKDQCDWDSKAFIPEPAFWKERKIADGTMAPSPPAGWGLEAAVNVLIELIHAWTGGLVAKKLSSVDKAVAQSASLLIVYFVGELVVKHVEFWWPVGTMSFVMALSVLLFTHATMTSRIPPEGALCVTFDSVRQCSVTAEADISNMMLDNQIHGA